MKLNEIRDNKGAMKTSKRLGRGIGSGKGKTSGKGVKGQRARTGIAVAGFEGGQMPIYRRTPKRGFTCPSSKNYVAINLGAIQAALEDGRLQAGSVINAEALQGAGFFKQVRDGVRILAKGELKQAVNIEAAGASQAAIAAVEKLGGKLIVPASAEA